MKKNIMIAAAIVAGSGIAAYLVKRFMPARNQADEQINPRTHHLTNAFARAKKHSVDAV